MKFHWPKKWSKRDFFMSHNWMLTTEKPGGKKIKINKKKSKLATLSIVMHQKATEAGEAGVQPFQGLEPHNCWTHPWTPLGFPLSLILVSVKSKHFRITKDLRTQDPLKDFFLHTERKQTFSRTASKPFLMWLFEGNTCISSYVWLKANQATPTHLQNYAWGPLSGLLWKKKGKRKKKEKNVHHWNKAHKILLLLANRSLLLLVPR